MSDLPQGGDGEGQRGLEEGRGVNTKQPYHRTLRLFRTLVVRSLSPAFPRPAPIPAPPMPLHADISPHVKACARGERPECQGGRRGAAGMCVCVYMCVRGRLWLARSAWATPRRARGAIALHWGVISGWCDGTRQRCVCAAAIRPRPLGVFTRRFGGALPPLPPRACAVPARAASLCCARVRCLFRPLGGAELCTLTSVPACVMVSFRGLSACARTFPFDEFVVHVIPKHL